MWLSEVQLKLGEQLTHGHPTSHKHWVTQSDFTVPHAIGVYSAIKKGAAG